MDDRFGPLNDSVLLPCYYVYFSLLFRGGGENERDDLSREVYLERSSGGAGNGVFSENISEGGFIY